MSLDYSLASLNFALFRISCCLLCGLGAEGPVQSNHSEGTDGQVRLSGITLPSKRLVSMQIAGRRQEDLGKKLFGDDE
jgi:hypothetical protein